MKRLVVGLLLGTMSLGVIGCSAETNDSITDKNVEVEQPQELTKNNRIITSSVAVVELLDKLEADMVGILTSSYELPERVTDVTRIGNPMQPDIILRMTHAEPEAAKAMFDEEFKANQGWQHFDAVKEGGVYDLPNGYFGMSANLLAIDAMEYLTDLFYE